MATNDRVEIECEVGHETAKALLIKIEGKEYWLPLSQVHEIHRDNGFVVVTRWIAVEKGLL
jgi:hypothetical protein